MTPKAEKWAENQRIVISVSDQFLSTYKHTLEFDANTEKSITLSSLRMSGLHFPSVHEETCQNRIIFDSHANISSTDLSRGVNINIIWCQVCKESDKWGHGRGLVPNPKMSIWRRVFLALKASKRKIPATKVLDSWVL